MARLSYSTMTRKVQVANGSFGKAKAALPERHGVELVAVIANYLCVSHGRQALAINAADPL